MSSVSSHLEQQHGVRIPPGGKGVCPFCRRETFSVRKDDTVGKCFHPACGRAITSGSLEGGYDGSLYQILDRIKDDCHAELVRQKDDPGGYAWKFLTVGRGVHEDVLSGLPELGAVPRSFDVSKVFAPKLDNLASRRKELLDKIEESQKRRLKEKEERNEKHKKGEQKSAPTAKDKTELEKGWEKQLAQLDQQRHFLEAQQRVLAERLALTAGWLAFFHTDQHHRVRSVRFRKPGEKKFQSYSPFTKGGTGLFGHGLFTPYRTEARKGGNRLIIVEGEINLLRVHGLAAQTADKENGRSSPHYANWIAATGSANTIDVTTIDALLKTPGAVRPLVVIQDNDEAGDKMVAALSQAFTLDVVKPPGRGEDVDDYIRGFGDDHHGAWAGLAELIHNRVRLCRPWAALAAQIFRTRQKQGEDDQRREFEINAQVKDIVLADLNERGKFYHEHSQGYYFHEEEKRLVPLDDRDRQVSCVLDRYGLNPVEKACEYAKEALHLESLCRGAETRVHRLVWFDPQSFTLYLFNHKDQIYRITADAIELVDNGSDGVLFLSDPRNEPFELVPDEDLGDLFRQLVTEEINFDKSDRLTLAEQRMIFDHWFYSIFFGSIMPTRPLLAFIGPKGSGKSYTLKRVGMLLFGLEFQVKNLPASEGDFDAVTTNCYYAGFDNADSKVKWLPDRLAICATGGTVSKRVLFTTNTLVDYPIDCFVGITSRAPHFNRDDVADRMLIHYVKRFAPGQYRSEHALKAAMLKDRNRIMTAVVRRLQECLAALKQTEGKTYRTSFRMADFAVFCLRLADVKGRCGEFEAVFAKMEEEQAEFTLEGDSLIDMLGMWLDVVETEGTKTTHSNRGRYITAKQLFSELAALAEAKGTKFDYQGGRSLGQRLRHIESNLQSVLKLEVDQSSTKNQKRYSFWPLEEAKPQAQAPESESPGIDLLGDSGAAKFWEERA